MVIIIVLVFNMLFSLLCVIGLNRRAGGEGSKRVIYGHSGQKAKRLSTVMLEGVRRASAATNDTAITVNTAAEFSPAYMTWSGLCYDVDLPKERGKPQVKKRILSGVNGYVKPGQLMALMGASGAGKTTLLDVLAQRKTGGHVSGKVQINNQDQDHTFPRISGYVEQVRYHCNGSGCCSAPACAPAQSSW